MLISTVEELRAFFPAHTLRNLDTMRGFLNNSENTFLRQRIGQPLLSELNRQYPALIEQVIDAHTNDSTHDSTLNSVTVPDASPSGSASVPAALAEFSPADLTPWVTLIILCQRCIVYDAFMRAADISPISANDMGLNIAESDNFAAASDKRIDRYKSSLSHEAHDAVDRLLIQLEEWQLEYSRSVDSGASAVQSDAVPDASPSGSTVPDASPSASSPIHIILSLWHQSPTYYLTDGLLFNTATEFNTYVDIYDSRDRFIQLLPDIRYCQELHIEAEIGTDLLLDLKQKHRAGTLNSTEQKAYTKLQRSLSLYVEARNKMFSRTEARDEACGYMNLTTAYIRNHQRDFDEAAMKSSPLYDPHKWPISDHVPDASPSGHPAPVPSEHDPSHAEHHHPAPFLAPPPHHPHCHAHHTGHHDHDDDHGMLITSLI